MAQKHLHFDYKAEYHTIGPELRDAKDIFLVFHGYGMLAKYFIKKFVLLSSENRVIAPQGLSKFYLEGFDGRIGATWMTREERLTDIENYVSYISEVYQTELKDISPEQRIHLIGFSQGAATVTRFAVSSHLHFDTLTLWAGIFPPDLNFQDASEILSNKSVNVVLGDKDPFLNQEREKEFSELTSKLKISPKIYRFDGDHNIYDEQLEILVKNNWN